MALAFSVIKKLQKFIGEALSSYEHTAENNFISYF